MNRDQDQAGLYTRYLLSQIQRFGEAFQELLFALTANDYATKLAAAKSLLQTIDGLENALSPEDNPPWLVELKNGLNGYITKQKSARKDMVASLMEVLLSHYHEIADPNWPFKGRPEFGAIDFDQIFEDYYAESRLPQLFDALVEQLEKVIATGAVDSLAVRSAFEKLIATIRRNKTRSYLAVYGTRRFVATLARNIAWKYVRSIGAITPLVEGVEQTFKEIHQEGELLEAKLQEALGASFQARLPSTIPNVDILALPPAGEPEPPATQGIQPQSTVEPEDPVPPQPGA